MYRTVQSVFLLPFLVKFKSKVECMKTTFLFKKRLLLELTMQGYIDEFASTYIEKECNKTILGRVFWDIKNYCREKNG